MTYDPNMFSTIRAEHELRVREARRAWEAGAKLRPDRGRTEQAALRHRAGIALIALGHRIGGTPPLAPGKLGRVAG
jgi:hypothetical protein